MSDSYDFLKTDQSISRALEDGYQAFKDGIQLQNNPHKAGSILEDCWRFGWEEAARERCD